MTKEPRYTAVDIDLMRGAISLTIADDKTLNSLTPYKKAMLIEKMLRTYMSAGVTRIELQNLWSDKHRTDN